MHRQTSTMLHYDVDVQQGCKPAYNGRTHLKPLAAHTMPCPTSCLPCSSSGCGPRNMSNTEAAQKRESQVRGRVAGQMSLGGSAGRVVERVMLDVPQNLQLPCSAMPCHAIRAQHSPVTRGLELTQMRLVLRSLSRPGVMAAGQRRGATMRWHDQGMQHATRLQQERHLRCSVAMPAAHTLVPSQPPHRQAVQPPNTVPAHLL